MLLREVRGCWKTPNGGKRASLSLFLVRLLLTLQVLVDGIRNQLRDTFLASLR
jgi:hypothetical protein